jgi:hypothetical protein
LKLATEGRLKKHYLFSGTVNHQMFRDDLWALVRRYLIKCAVKDEYEKDPQKLLWRAYLTEEGLQELAELEKSWLRRVFEKNPPHWCQVALTALSAGLALLAFLQSIGWVDLRPVLGGNARVDTSPVVDSQSPSTKAAVATEGTRSP